MYRTYNNPEQYSIVVPRWGLWLSLERRIGPRLRLSVGYITHIAPPRRSITAQAPIATRRRRRRCRPTLRQRLSLRRVRLIHLKLRSSDGGHKFVRLTQAAMCSDEFIYTHSDSPRWLACDTRSQRIAGWGEWTLIMGQRIAG